MKIGLKHKLLFICLINVVVINSLWFFVGFSLLTLLLSILVAIAGIMFTFKGIEKRFLALETGLLNLKDNEFNTVLPSQGNDEITKLEHLFNQACDKLRQEKQSIYQRELLLDTVIQTSPLAMLLIANDQHIIYSNHAARTLLSAGKDLDGQNFTTLLKQQQKSLQQVVGSGRDGLFNLSIEHNKDDKNSKNQNEQETQTWLLSRGEFVLNGMTHQLYLFKQLTRELNRQEVVVWKKVIRVISHELNNSLAPISSMTHSGQLLIKNLGNEKLDRIFSTIEERVKHLSQFIAGYGKLAKLPLPRREKIDWWQFIPALQQQIIFTWDQKTPEIESYLDIAQLQQVLLNLLKNAHESGSSAEDIALRLTSINHGLQLEVTDRGSGMSDEVLKNALLPFYSTKTSGSGIGLPLCREIIEAHDGYINLINRKQGGLKIVVWVP
ncbi:MAG: histidine kinase [Gammaproteobacteria bacterium]|nr:MAG: histidine kinase [Gammaproteobacteria bacterium]